MTAPNSVPTPIKDALELIIEHGMDDLGEAIRILLNEAMKIERAYGRWEGEHGTRSPPNAHPRHTKAVAKILAVKKTTRLKDYPPRPSM